MDLHEWLQTSLARLPGAGKQRTGIFLAVVVALVAACGTAALPGDNKADSVSATDGLSAQAAPALAGPGHTAARPVSTSQWNLAWRAEDTFPGATTTTTSCRFLAKLVVGGSRIQAEFSGLANQNGYSVRSASIAPAASLTSLEVRPGASHPLTFGGQPGATVGAGSSVLSDPVSMPIHAGQPVLVTVTASAGDALLKGGLSEPGGCSTAEVPNAGTAPASAFPTVGNVHWLRSLLVDGPAPARLAAVLGDSITEGPGPRYAGDYPRWTDVLGRSGLPVVNAGVGGNALTRPGMFGTQAGVERATALLAEPGLTDFVICMGTNDLAFGQTDEQVLAGLDTVIQAARARGLRVFVCTISARQKVGWGSTKEHRREAINAAVLGSWLHDRGAMPIDTDSAVRDPSAPTYLRAAYDSGDHLHPNVAGSYAIGAAAAAAFGLPTPPVSEPAPTGV